MTATDHRERAAAGRGSFRWVPAAPLIRKCGLIGSRGLMGGRGLVGGCFLVGACVLIGACGLPFPSTLPSPESCPAGTPGVLSFCGSSVQPPFQGYEIYYTIRTANEGAPSEPLHHDDLRARFGRLSAADSRSCATDRPPLIRATDAERDHTVHLDLTVFRLADTSDTEPFLRLSWRSGEIPVRRDVEDDFEQCRHFSDVDGYRAEDIDVTPAAAAAIGGAGGVIYLHAYAVSYGLDRGHPRYSAPLRIGRVELALPFQ
ncbi:MAG: hypothetical protein OXC31_27080 [Spirochaetaceae bacterium]|nr:hypothetical protein [Spirochaetaceae bacterium]